MNYLISVSEYYGIECKEDHDKIKLAYLICHLYPYLTTECKVKVDGFKPYFFQSGCGCPN